MGNKREKDRELWEKIKKTAKPLDNSLASRFEEAIGKKVPEKTPPKEIKVRQEFDMTSPRHVVFEIW